MVDFFEDLVYSEADIITFPSGIPGFEDNKLFVVVSIPQFAPFEWLVCVDGTHLRFAMINPLLFSPDYAPKLSAERLAELSVDNSNDLALYAIVTIRENSADTTANLAGPVFINKNKKIGKQIIIDDDRYSTQEPLIRRGASC
ncbi:MAG: flagellar assembly protein FliW [Chitinispirillales bacterium]|jgi:flagellar assembly factor FliW|nr:flagellar assembly protein FliW [Chitinispirillales bacterium]